MITNVSLQHAASVFICILPPRRYIHQEAADTKQGTMSCGIYSSKICNNLTEERRGVERQCISLTNFTISRGGMLLKNVDC
jgi:hypothetical protein